VLSRGVKERGGGGFATLTNVGRVRGLEWRVSEFPLDIAGLTHNVPVIDEYEVVKQMHVASPPVKLSVAYSSRSCTCRFSFVWTARFEPNTYMHCNNRLHCISVPAFDHRDHRRLQRCNALLWQYASRPPSTVPLVHSHQAMRAPAPPNAGTGLVSPLATTSGLPRKPSTLKRL
jgi:hypothetical protein